MYRSEFEPFLVYCHVWVMMFVVRKRDNCSTFCPVVGGSGTGRGVGVGRCVRWYGGQR